MPQNSRKATGTLLTVSPDQRSKIKGHADESGAKLEAGNWKLETGNWRFETGDLKLEALLAGNWKLEAQEAGNWKLET